MSLRGVPEGVGQAQPAAAVAAVLFEVVGDVMGPMEREPGTGITAELVCGACRRWRDLREDTLYADKEHRPGPLLGTTSYDWAGRGATAVWRAERQVCPAVLLGLAGRPHRTGGRRRMVCRWCGWGSAPDDG
ncbi:hypothetical protein OOK58_04405 [Streptomyces sp. NBC_01728]|uniref:hypothetical protein n=1 Tax=unclassified Streptomyces TaxID=2593676 RepID=UPI0022543125|nr:MULTISPECIES: hypothetical protein [unclassified Streptomyces]MCX4461857.1 hypothetical protein [Streptomyces sp. NBC_01719]MCX4490765.1 hypothetical protein [Streptomyces sp. NBC_01728]